MIEVGKMVPEFEAAMTGERRFRLSDYRGKYLVLYFYPKDNTSGCTLEGQEFGVAHGRFQQLDAEIVGVSRDSLKSHERFIAKHGFPFALISDSDEAVCRHFDVIREKKMYGKTVMGVQRSTFIIGPDGILLREWRHVKVTGHVQAVLEELESLRAG